MGSFYQNGIVANLHDFSYGTSSKGNYTKLEKDLMKFSTDNPAVRTSFDKRCPSEQPEIGRNNSCQNGLSEKEIKAASKPPIGMGGKLVSNSMGK